MASPQQSPDDETIEADERDARARHDADRAPTATEEADAERNTLDPGTAQAYEEAIERGANVKGEGRVELHAEGEQ
jgi:hypothetical protein